jgi:surface protein
MSSIVEKLNEINDIKNNIKQAIRDKGVDVVDGTPFAEYPNCIRNISGGSGGSYYENLYNQMTNDGYNMDGLFAYIGTGNTIDLTGLDFSKVESANNMFYECSSRITLGQCNTSNLRFANSMFQNFTNGNNYIDLSVLDFSKLESARSIFYGCNLDNIDIRNINLNFGNVYRSSHGMFNNSTGTLDLSNWSIDGVNEIHEFFANCMCSRIDLTNWKTTNIVAMDRMFSYCTNLQELIIPDWDMTNVQNCWNMLNGCDNLRYVDIRNCNGDTVSKILEQLPTKSEANFGEIELPEGSSRETESNFMAKYWKPTSLEATIITSGDLSVGMNQIMVGEKTPITLSNCIPWYGTRDNIIYVSSNTDAVIIEGNNAKAVGEGEAQITAINSNAPGVVSNNPVTITVTLTDANPGLIMFKANNLNIEREIWIGQINNQEYISRQLSYSDGVYSLNVGAPITQLRVYDSSNISEIVKLNMSSMTCYQEVFWGCTNLEYVDANNWVNENTTQVNHLFTNCTGLKEVDISNWNAENLNYINAFMGCTSLHTIRMDNCNNDTISKVIITEDFPSSNQGTIYCKRANAAGLEAPGNWTFSYID